MSFAELMTMIEENSVETCEEEYTVYYQWKARNGHGRFDMETHATIVLALSHEHAVDLVVADVMSEIPELYDHYYLNVWNEKGEREVA